MSAPSDRLDSWKALADYLGRDVRTLRRWEERGLPVRRVAGERGHSVFAFKSEIDAWLKFEESGDRPLVSAPAEPEPQPGLWRHRRWVAWAGIVMGAMLTWKVLGPAAESSPLQVEVTPVGVVAVDRAGTERWRYDFPPEGRSVLAPERSSSIVVAGIRPGVLVASNAVNRVIDDVPESGILRWFSVNGALLSSFAFDDRLTFAGEVFDGAWALTDFGPNDATGRRRVAVAAHHFTWWPSVVTILNERWQREGTFVHSGWVESLSWLSGNRLLIAGYNEARAGGMVALLDADNIHGASPEEPGSRFACDACGTARPLAYVVLPRSELNLITGSAFNRASIEPTLDGVMVTTSEIDREEKGGPLMAAVYEFSPTLQLRRVSYDSRYWDRHLALEREGTVTHSREACPERNGPPLIHIWDPARGWRTIRTRAH